MNVNEQIKNKAIEAIAADKFTNDTTKYIDFAFYLIDQNIESKNIYILAGLEKDSYYDKILYFNKVLDELKIIINWDSNFYLIYAQHIAKQVIANQIDPLIGNNYMVKLFMETDHNSLYVEFLEISDGIDLFDDGYELIQGMRKENVKEYIKHCFELFLIFQNLKLSKNFYEQAYCKKCNERIIPRKVNKREGIFGKKYVELICPNCGYNQFYWTRYNQGKDLYLKEIGK
jgi:RNase P subunit RPR2